MHGEFKRTTISVIEYFGKVRVTFVCCLIYRKGAKFGHTLLLDYNTVALGHLI